MNNRNELEELRRTVKYQKEKIERLEQQVKNLKS